MTRRLHLVATLVAVLAAATACSDDGGGIRIAAATGTPGNAATATAATTRTPLPPRPGNPFSGGIAVAGYLAGGGANLGGCLPELVQAWAMGPVDGDRCRQLDFDGDGRPEFVFVASFPDGGPNGAPADVWFFDDQASGYRLVNTARGLANATLANARIVAAEDLTADRVPEVVIAWQSCGASTCTTDLVIASQQGNLLDNLVPRDLALPSVESITVKQGVIAMKGGQVASAGAGPSRGQTVTVTWGGERFRKETQLEPPAYLVHALNDADTAFASGDFAGARALYERAATDSTLKDWKQESGGPAARLEVAAYALFHASLAALRQGDGTATIALLDRAVAGHEATMSGRAAAAYRDALRAGGSSSVACAAAEAYLATVAVAYAEQWNYGDTNPERGVVTFCR